MAETKKKLPLTIFEIVAYSILGLLAVWGLVYICLGISCVFIKYDSELVKANAKLNLGFLIEGIIILAVAAAAAVVVLLLNAKTADREYEKVQRRAAARANRKFGSSDAPVVDAEVSEVKAE